MAGEFSPADGVGRPFTGANRRTTLERPRTAVSAIVGVNAYIKPEQ
jgi:hypothetical protein